MDWQPINTCPEDKHVQVSLEDDGVTYYNAGIRFGNGFRTDMGPAQLIGMYSKWRSIENCQCRHCTRIIHTYS